MFPTTTPADALRAARTRAHHGERFPCECAYAGPHWKGSDRCAHCGGVVADAVSPTVRLYVSTTRKFADADVVSAARDHLAISFDGPQSHPSDWDRVTHVAGVRIRSDRAAILSVPPRFRPCDFNPDAPTCALCGDGIASDVSMAEFADRPGVLFHAGDADGAGDCLDEHGALAASDVADRHAAYVVEINASWDRESHAVALHGSGFYPATGDLPYCSDLAAAMRAGEPVTTRIGE